MINIDLTKLKYLYSVEQKTLSELADIFNVSVPVIRDRLKKLNLRLRTSAETRNLKAIQIDIAEAERLYFEKRLTLAEVGEWLGVSGPIIGKRLVGAGHELRRAGVSANPEKREMRSRKFTHTQIAEMVRLYCEGEESAHEIAYRFDCGPTTITTHLKRQGVRIRTALESQAIRRKREAAAKAKQKESVESIPKNEATPETILRLRNDENLTIDAIAERCSLKNLEVYNVLLTANAL